jgi:hypothetical protein
MCHSNISDNPYLEAIRHLADTHNEKVFKNKGKNDAITVLAELLNHAKEEVLIFSGNSTGEVSDSEIYDKAIINYIDNSNGVIKVFVENDLKDTSNFKVYQTLLERSIDNERVKIKKAGNEFLESVNSFFQNKYHFLVADKCMYRVETNPDTFKAIGSFNSPEFCSKLSNLFNNYFDR